jgi:outer membrane protein OmpA-like peptidoglycan-associated protein
METENLNRVCRFAAIGVVLVMGTLSVGCSLRDNVALDQARANYMQTVQDPKIVTNAPAPLQDAETMLRQAEKTDDQQDKEQLAYLTNQKVGIAQATAQKKIAEAETQRRERALLEARTHEAAQAQQQALSAEARTEQLEQELAEFKARETDRGLVLTLGDVLFEFSRAELKPGALHKLYPLVTFLTGNPTRDVLIEGHADSIGSHSYNLELSQLRADVVRNFLLQNGISPARITARGYGKDFPVASNATEAGRQQNRRVELTILHDGERTALRLR